MRKVAIVDYGTGNIASLGQAFAVIGSTAFLATSPVELATADAVVLPGVGHFGAASEALRGSGMLQELVAAIRSGMPALGICLGFQLLTGSSEEAPDVPGLQLLPQPLRTVRIRPGNTHRYKVPHLGWNSISTITGESTLLRGIPSDQQLFYYANAYAVSSTNPPPGPHATYDHEKSWLALVEHGNLHGVQFHPEKSRGQGLQLLRNFLQV